MVLTEFEFEGRQAITEARCDEVPQLMVIAGPNGVGKSTLLQNLHQQIRSYANDRRDNPTSPLSFDGETKSVYFTPHRVPGDNSSFNRRDLFSGQSTPFQSLMADNTNIPNIGRYPSNRNRSGPDATAFLGLARRMAEFTERRRALAMELIDQGESVDRELLPDVEEPLRSLIDRVVPGISFNGVQEQNDIYELSFENRTGDEVQFEQLSSGEIDIITMLFFIAERQIEDKIREYSDDDDVPDEDVVVLIDGPESYLHPYLQLQFIEFLSDYIQNHSDLQVILVTHSDVILNNSPRENLYYLSYPDMVDENQLQSAASIDVSILQDIVGEIGTSALSTGNPLLLVEGKSDREVLVRLYPSIRESLTILPMEGKHNIINLDRAFDKLLPNLIESGIRIHAIVDQDQDSITPSTPYIHELPVVNMENVLLDQDAIFRTIDSLASQESLEDKGIASLSDVQDLLNGIITRQSMVNNEIRLRLNEKLKFQVGFGASEDITQETVLEKFDEVTSTNRENLIETYEGIKEEVETASVQGDFEKFDGKRIIGEIAGEFDIHKESVRRLTANNIQSMDCQPRYLNEILEQISSDIGVELTE